jgi:hypothetical protein
MSQEYGQQQDPLDLVPVRDDAGLVLEIPEMEARALQSLLISCGIPAVLSPFTAYTFMLVGCWCRHLRRKKQLES